MDLSGNLHQHSKVQNLSSSGWTSLASSKWLTCSKSTIYLYHRHVLLCRKKAGYFSYYPSCSNCQNLLLAAFMSTNECYFHLCLSLDHCPFPDPHKFPQGLLISVCYDEMSDEIVVCLVDFHVFGLPLRMDPHRSQVSLD